MAIFHCQIKIISRGKGKTATAAAAYRSGTKIVDDEFGKTHDYTRKRGVAFSEILLCVNAPSKYSDRQTLWNEVQKIEKQKNAQLCREVEVALPIEFSRNEQIEVVREYIKKNFTDKGMIADWSLHDKSDGNPHAHILLTMRPLKPNGEWEAKRKDRYALDENGNKIPIIDVLTNKQKIGAGGRKMWERISVQTTDWNDQTKAEEWRKSWADICNEHLKGQAHIDHRSYARQRKKQLPTMHEGYVARKIAKSGKHSNIISYNQQVRQHNALEQANEQDIQVAEDELQQLEKELEKLKSEQKGQEQDGFSSIRRDFAKLLERGKRTIDGVMEFMEALITANEDKDEIIKQLKMEISNLKQQQEQQIQTLSSDKQKLLVTVQEQQSQIAQQAGLIEKLNNSDKQYREAQAMKKEAEKMMRASEEQMKAAQRLAHDVKIQKLQLEAREENMKKQIEKSAQWKAEQMVQDIKDDAKKKVKRTVTFAGSSISIVGIALMCVTGIWLSDHIGVFVGKTGVANFFISLWDGFILICNGTGSFLNSFIELLQGCTSLDVAQSIVYGISLLLVFGLVVLSILEGIPSMRKKFESIIRTYKNSEEFGYKKAMTIALCIIALFFAILIAEYAMLNVIAMWLLLSLSFNLLYHLITYPKY